MVLKSAVRFLFLFVLVDAILQKVVFLNKKSGNFSFYSSFHLVISRRYEKSIFQATTIFSSIFGVFRRSAQWSRSIEEGVGWALLTYMANYAWDETFFAPRPTLNLILTLYPSFWRKGSFCPKKWKFEKTCQNEVGFFTQKM